MTLLSEYSYFRSSLRDVASLPKDGLNPTIKAFDLPSLQIISNVNHGEAKHIWKRTTSTN